MDEKYGCQIKVDHIDSTKYSYSQLLKDIKAGNCSYDIIHYSDKLLYAIGKDIFVPLDEYIDFNEIPFNSHLQDMALWHRKHYGLFVPVKENIYNELPMDMVYKSCINYNKHLLEENGIQDIFELQEKGLWTWDMLLEISQRITGDTNGDGINDVWGLSSTSATFLLYRLIFSNGSNIIEEGEYPGLVANLNTPSAIKAADFLHQLVNVNNVVNFGNENVSSTSGTSSNRSYLSNLMNSNKIGISTDSLIYHSDEYKRGWALFPKGPDTGNYRCILDRLNFYVIPSTVKNVKEAAVILKELYQYANEERNKYITLCASKDFDEKESIIFKRAINNFNYVYTTNIGISHEDILNLISEENKYLGKLKECESKAQEYLNTILQ